MKHASHRKEDGKNGFENTEGLQYTGSSLHLGTRSSHQSKVKCVFCRGSHFSDKCSVISDCEARKKFLTENKKCFLCLGSGHLSWNSVKNKTCYYCKGMHNSAICYNKNKSTKTEEKEKNETETQIDKNETAANCASSISSILLQTAEIIVENPLNKKEVRVKILFDQGSQSSYITKRIKNILDLKPYSKESISISTFGNTKYKQNCLEKVSLNSKNNSNDSFSIEALCTDFICLPIKNQKNR